MLLLLCICELRCCDSACVTYTADTAVTVHVLLTFYMLCMYDLHYRYCSSAIYCLKVRNKEFSLPTFLWTYLITRNHM